MGEASVFVVSMQAVAGPQNAAPDGRGYDLLVFARASSEPDAEAAALRGVTQLGWIHARALRCAEVLRPDALPSDFAPSYRRALKGGCAVIVYDEP
jgi:hypothetical protein